MIIANGDSFTQEIYLDYKDRWTTNIGVDINLAMGGGSHERVLKTTIEALNHYDTKCLIVGWPTSERMMLPLSNGSIAKLSAHQSIDENTTENHQNIRDFYIKHCFNPYYHFKQRLEYMVFLQNYCLSKKIKILYFLSIHETINETTLRDLSREAFMDRSNKDIEHAGINYNFKILNTLMSKIQDTVWIKQPWYSMDKHCQNFERKPCGHPAEEGSDAWANLVKQYL